MWVSVGGLGQSMKPLAVEPVFTPGTTCFFIVVLVTARETLTKTHIDFINSPFPNLELVHG